MKREKVTILSKVDKSLINTYPVVKFPGETVVINTVQEAEDAVLELKKEKYIGFDTETKPSFQRGVHYKVSLLQFSTLTKAYLFRLHLTGFPDCLVDILQSPDIVKVGLSTKDDFSALSARRSFDPAGFVELQDYVHALGIEEIGLQRLYALLFNMKISKAQRLSNWQAEELLPSQICYAATDAWTTLKIWMYLDDLVKHNMLIVNKVPSETES